MAPSDERRGDDEVPPPKRPPDGLDARRSVGRPAGTDASRTEAAPRPATKADATAESETDAATNPQIDPRADATGDEAVESTPADPDDVESRWWLWGVVSLFVGVPLAFLLTVGTVALAVSVQRQWAWFVVAVSVALLVGVRLVFPLALYKDAAAIRASDGIDWWPSPNWYAFAGVLPFPLSPVVAAFYLVRRHQYVGMF